MNCPKCGGTLAAREFGDVVVDQCESCNGIWLDLGELPALIAFHRENGAANSDAVLATAPIYDQISGPCPRCEGQGNMTRVTNLHNSELVMDSCPVCYGIWLDGGELQRLMDRGVGFKIKSFLSNLFG